MQRRQVLRQGAGWLGAASLGAWPHAGQAQQVPGLKGQNIVLGQSAAFSGPAEQLGLQYYLGAKLYFDSVNAAGGVNGRKIAYSQIDDGYDMRALVHGPSLSRFERDQLAGADLISETISSSVSTRFPRLAAPRTVATSSGVAS